MPDETIPRIVKEVTQAIFEKRRGQWLDALAIARGQLVNNGFLTTGSDTGPLNEMKLTSKGNKRNREHLRKSARRSITFERMLDKYGKDLPGAEADPSDERE